MRLGRWWKGWSGGGAWADTADHGKLMITYLDLLVAASPSISSDRFRREFEGLRELVGPPFVRARNLSTCTRHGLRHDSGLAAADAAPTRRSCLGPIATA